MAEKKRDKTERESGINVNLEGIFSGLGNLVDKLAHLAEKGKELKETEESRQSEKKTGGVCGFSIKVGGLGADKVDVEPFGNIRKDEKGDIEVNEIREPLVDIFEETDHINIVAEMPGIDEKDIRITLKDDILHISAETKEKKYGKEILLKEAFTGDKMTYSYKNGILEIKLAK